jgi:hypothetical protein
MDKKDKIEFNPDIELDRGEVSALAAIVSQPGFAVLNKIGKACVDQFVVTWINQDKPDDVVRAHHRAKVAAQVYTALMQRIQYEVDMYIQSQPNDKPIEAGIGVDLGEHTDPETFIAYGEEEPLNI